jgi:hypothetical protein
MATLDVQRTVLRVRLQPEASRLEAEGEVTLLARRDDVASASLVLAEVFAQPEFRVGGEARATRSRPFRWANTPARLWEIPLPAAAAKGKRVAIAFRYAGTWPAAQDALDGRIKSRLSWMLPQAPWYPRLGTGRVGEDDAGEVELTLTAPAGQRVIASGARDGANEANRPTEHRWRASLPGPAFFVAGELQAAESSSWNGKPLTWYTPLAQEHRSTVVSHPRSGAPSLADVRLLLEAQVGLFGPLPQPRLSVVQLPAPWPADAAYAAPGALLFGAEAPDVSRLAHELAHQWWGLAVQTPLLEGLATYAEWRFGPRHPDPGGSYLDFVTGHTDVPIRDALYRFEEPERRALAYDKLATVLVMLEDVMGPDRFARLLRQFQRENAGRRTRLEEFQSLARSLARRDLDGFFNQWVHQPGLPTVRLVRATARAEAGRSGAGSRWRLTLQITQAAPPFRLTAAVAVTTTGGDEMRGYPTSERHTVELAGVDQTVMLDCRAQPTAVTLDPDRRLLLDRRESRLTATITEAD